MAIGIVMGRLFKELELERERPDIVRRFASLLSYYRDYKIVERKLTLAEIEYVLDGIVRCIRGWIACDTVGLIGKRVFLFEYEEDEKPYPVLVVIDYRNEKVYYVEPKE